MEKKEMINVDDFMSMFVAVSFLQEQRFFNIESFKNYLHSIYHVDENVINQINLAISGMENAKMICKVPKFDYLYKVSNDIPFKEIVFDNYEYLDGMMNFFYNYNNFPHLNMNHVSKEDKGFGYIKK